MFARKQVVIVHVLLFILGVIIFVRCVTVRCVSAAIVGGGDKPPCATDRVRNRIVIIVRKCSLFHVFIIVGYVFCIVKVMFSVSQSFVSSRVCCFSVVTLRNLSSLWCPATTALVVNGVGTTSLSSLCLRVVHI